MDLYRYDSALRQFEWWLELSWVQNGQKVQNRGFLGLLWLLDSVVWVKKLFKKFKPRSYMTTHVRYLNTKFPDDPTALFNWLAAEWGKLWIFGIFQQKKGFVTLSNDLIFFLHFSRTKNLLFWHNHAQVWSRSKKGFWISNIIFADRFQKYPFTNSFFPFRN